MTKSLVFNRKNASLDLRCCASQRLRLAYLVRMLLPDGVQVTPMLLIQHLQPPFVLALHLLPHLLQHLTQLSSHRQSGAHGKPWRSGGGGASQAQASGLCVCVCVWVLPLVCTQSDAAQDTGFSDPRGSYCPFSAGHGAHTAKTPTLVLCQRCALSARKWTSVFKPCIYITRFAQSTNRGLIGSATQNLFRNIQQVILALDTMYFIF